MDKKILILKFLYDNGHFSDLNYGDIKPIMNGWTVTQIADTLNQLHSKLGLIGLSGNYSFGASSQGSTLTSLDNYTATAYLTPLGEEYYQKYSERRWLKIKRISEIAKDITLILLSIMTLGLGCNKNKLNDTIEKQTTKAEMQVDTIVALRKKLDSLILSKNHLYLSKPDSGTTTKPPCDTTKTKQTK